MTKFYTSDTHFGHANIIKYCNRPFASAGEMDDALVARWNEVVGKSDEVWHLGDFSMSNDAGYLAGVFHRLNGRKFLVRGNHDQPNVLNLPWDGPVEHMAFVTDEGQRIVLCHYALRVWHGMNRKAISLYGHSHGTLSDNSMSLDVGVDCCDYRPVTLAQIRRVMRKLPPPAEIEAGAES